MTKPLIAEIQTLAGRLSGTDVLMSLPAQRLALLTSQTARVVAFQPLREPDKPQMVVTLQGAFKLLGDEAVALLPEARLQTFKTQLVKAVDLIKPLDSIKRVPRGHGVRMTAAESAHYQVDIRTRKRRQSGRRKEAWNTFRDKQRAEALARYPLPLWGKGESGLIAREHWEEHFLPLTREQRPAFSDITLCDPGLANYLRAYARKKRIKLNVLVIHEARAPRPRSRNISTILSKKQRALEQR